MIPRSILVKIKRFFWSAFWLAMFLTCFVLGILLNFVEFESSMANFMIHVVMILCGLRGMVTIFYGEW